MFFRLMVWCFGFVWASSVFALQGECENKTDALLWSAQGKQSVVYMFGSIHLGDSGFYPLDKVVESAFRRADYLVFEVHPDKISDPAVAVEMQRRGSFTHGKLLKDVVSKPVVNDLRRTLRKMGVKPDDFMHFRPWFITLMLTNMQMMSLGYQPQFGVENYIMRERNSQSKILALESLDNQIDLLESMDNEILLVMTLAQMENNQAVNELMNAWRCGKNDELYSLFSGEFSEEETGIGQMELDAIKKGLIDDRNKKMVTKINRFLKKGKGTYFVVVGAAHFLGEGSIVNLLEKKGYKIKHEKM